MPPKDRASTIWKIYQGLNDGGAFIFSEKGFSCNPKIQDMMTFMYYDYKRQHFSDTEILDKLTPFEYQQYLEILLLPNGETDITDTNITDTNDNYDDEFDFFAKLKN